MSEMINNEVNGTNLVEALASYNVEVTAGTVTSNISFIKSVMTAKREAIKNTVYSGTREEQIAMMKEEKAAVNNFKDALKKERTDVKNRLLKPFEAYDNEAKECIDIAQDTYDDLNRQVKALEEERRAEKRVKIRENYDKISEPLGDFADTFYSRIYKSEWENTAFSMKKIGEEQKAAVDSYVTGKTTLEMMTCEQDIKDAAIEMFNEKLDITVAMQHIAAETNKRAEEKAREEARIAAEKARMEAEYEAKLAAEKKRIEEEARIAAEKKAREEAQAAEEARRKAENAAREEAQAREAARLEAEKKACEEARIAAERKAREEIRAAQAAPAPSFTKPSFLADKPVNNHGASVKAAERICVEFFPEDWKMVKEFCEFNQIFFRVTTEN